MFERFWMCYPRKVGKDAAWSVWDRLKPDLALVDTMIAVVGRQCQSPQWLKDGGQYIPHPRTWLNQGRWQDEVGSAPPAAKSVNDEIDEWARS